MGGHSDDMESMPVMTSDDAGFQVDRGVTAKVKLTWKNMCILLLSLLIVLLLGVIIGQDSVKVLTVNRDGNDDDLNNKEVTSHEPSSGKVVPFDIAKMRKEIANKRSLLSEYYGEARWKDMLEKGFAIAPSSSSYKQGLKHIAKNMARSLVHQDKYIIGVIGSSVAAGHDNCNYDSYERQLERFFGPIWKAGGVELIVRNAGEGGGCGDSHRNQVFCVRNMVGDDVDLIHYSWTYFEIVNHGMNEHEQLARWALMMDKQPAVNLMNAGGDDGNCLPDDPNQQILKTYSAPYGFNALCLEAGLLGGGKYKGKKWGQVGDGLHNTTRYGESLNDTRRKENLGVVFVNWHPGPLGFQFVSDAFTWHYMNALQLALDNIEAALKNGKDLLTEFPKHYNPIMADELPKPVTCDPTICTLEEAPGCLNLEEPTYGWHQVSITAPDDELNPYRGQIKPVGEGWTHKKDEKGSFDLIPKFLQAKPECQHLDHCAWIEASSPKAGWLVFKLPKMEVGRVVVCGCCGKNVAEDMFINNADLEIQFDSNTLDRTTFKIWPEKKCAQVLETFPEHLNDEGGHLYLGVRLKADVSKPVKISHIIAF